MRVSDYERLLLKLIFFLQILPRQLVILKNRISSKIFEIINKKEQESPIFGLQKAKGN